MSHDLEETRDPLFVLPVPRRTLWLSLAGWLIVSGFLASVGIMNIHDLWTHDPTVFPLKGGDVRLVSGAERYAWIAFLVAACFVLPAAILTVVAVVTLRSSPLTIGKSGITMGPLVIPWDRVKGCRWNRYNPGLLEVQGQDGRHEYPVPEPYRAEVESALGNLGKWED